MKKNKSKKFLKLSLLTVLALALGGYFWAINNEGKLASVEAKSKSKWQKILEKNGIDQSFWDKYLPFVNHHEYKKVVKTMQENQLNSAETIVSAENIDNSNNSYPLHRNISTTYFWSGEDAGKDNFNIDNNSSCWDDEWSKHSAKENSFYFALPYNDLDDNGNRKAEALKIIPWAGEKKWNDSESICKNHWIKIIHNGKTAYAQWEDAGPCDDAGGCGENDKNYVFGTAQPKFSGNSGAGLDVSPAVKKTLGLKDVDKTDWQFVDEKDVPDGPWKKTITISGLNWK